MLKLHEIKLLHRVLRQAFMREEFARLGEKPSSACRSTVLSFRQPPPTSGPLRCFSSQREPAGRLNWSEPHTSHGRENTDLAAIYRELGLATLVNYQHAGAEGGVVLGGFHLARARVPGCSGTFPLHVVLWQQGLLRIESRVCRLEAGGRALGTGFLVGPDAVLTCYHPLESFIMGSQPQSLRLRFDYRVLADAVVNEGVIVGPHFLNWLIDSSPYSQIDLSDDLGEPNPLTTSSTTP